jgi:hypothetical protein
MNVSFATCCRQTAVGYLKRVYPTHGDKVVESALPVKELLDLVSADIVRVQDPKMYGENIGIMPGNNYTKRCSSEVREICMAFMEYMEKFY